ncbi:MAG: hypothetical protein OEZ35_02345 [Candidatus Bathyarchaeota archaeon]|nr:hypothetical protein [Candidatus Bathyarchaeota archaeon]
MEVKTKVGVQVEVHSKGSFKTMSFDRPVRSIELTKDESRHIGSLLSLEAKTGITAELRKLIIGKFFSSPKSFGNIREKLRTLGVEVKSASLNTILGKMVERKELTRAGTRGAYLYQASEEGG